MQRIKLVVFAFLLGSCNQPNIISPSQTETTAIPQKVVEDNPMQPISEAGVVIQSVPVNHAPSDRPINTVTLSLAQKLHLIVCHKRKVLLQQIIY
ncbi:MAG: hypothetical protein NTY88_08895 [Bacteroidetes bacterium]|nr:hypothetical protein [Bacteroidota bacterium]